ncbi:unnamed protein product [Amoebophrya sp. A25]|nr:unnamed protein product [Amoebophrya sp. A25]|eukprot:GSA25T00000128001.1
MEKLASVEHQGSRTASRQGGGLDVANFGAGADHGGRSASRTASKSGVDVETNIDGEQSRKRQHRATLAFAAFAGESLAEEQALARARRSDEIKVLALPEKSFYMAEFQRMDVSVATSRLTEDEVLTPEQRLLLEATASAMGNDETQRGVAAGTNRGNNSSPMSLAAVPNGPVVSGFESALALKAKLDAETEGSGMTNVNRLPQPLFPEGACGTLRTKLDKYVFGGPTRETGDTSASPTTGRDNSCSWWRMLDEVDGDPSERRLASLLLTGDYIMHCLEEQERTPMVIEGSNEEKVVIGGVNAATRRPLVLSAANEDTLHSNIGDRWEQLTLLQTWRDEEGALLSLLELMRTSIEEVRATSGESAAVEDHAALSALLTQSVHPEHDGNLMHDAVTRGFVAVCAWLKRWRRKDFYQMLTQIDQYGYTPLQYCVEEGNLFMFELLTGDYEGFETEVAATLNLRVPTITATREGAINQGAPYPFCVHGRTPLHGACFFGCRPIVEAILAHPLFLSPRSPAVRAYLSEATKGKEKDIPAYLLPAAALLEQEATTSAQQAVTTPIPGVSAKSLRQVARLELLVSAYMCDAMGRSPLHWACLGGHLAITQDLVALFSRTASNLSSEAKTASGGEAGGSSKVAAAPTAATVNERLAKLLTARDVEGHGALDFSCGATGATADRWFVRGKMQQELKVIMPGVVLSQGTDGHGLCRARWAGREVTLMLPVGDLRSTGIEAYLKYLMVDFLSRTVGLVASNVVVTLHNANGALSSGCKQTALHRLGLRSAGKSGAGKKKKRGQSSKGDPLIENAVLAASESSSKQDPSKAREQNAQKQGGEAQGGEDSVESGGKKKRGGGSIMRLQSMLNATETSEIQEKLEKRAKSEGRTTKVPPELKASMVLASYVWLDDRLVTAEQDGAFVFSPREAELEGRLIDSRGLVRDRNMPNFLIPDHVRVLCLDARVEYSLRRGGGSGRMKQDLLSSTAVASKYKSGGTASSGSSMDMTRQVSVTQGGDFQLSSRSATANYSSRILFLHHSGNATLARYLLHAVARVLQALAPSHTQKNELAHQIRATRFVLPSLALETGFVGRCIYNQLRAPPSGMNFRVSAESSGLLLEEIFTQILKGVTFPASGAGVDGGKIGEGPLSFMQKLLPGVVSLTDVLQKQTAVLPFSARFDKLTAQSRKQFCAEEMSPAPIVKLFLQHSVWRNQITRWKLLQIACEACDVESVRQVLAGMRQALADLVDQEWRTESSTAIPPPSEKESCAMRIARCVAAVEKALFGSNESVTEVKPQTPILPTEIARGSEGPFPLLPPGYFGRILLNLVGADLRYDRTRAKQSKTKGGPGGNTTTDAASLTVASAGNLPANLYTTEPVSYRQATGVTVVDPEVSVRNRARAIGPKPSEDSAEMKSSDPPSTHILSSSKETLSPQVPGAESSKNENADANYDSNEEHVAYNTEDPKSDERFFNSALLQHRPVDLLRILVRFFLHDLLDGVCAQLERYLSAALPGSLFAQRMVVNAVTVELARRVQFRLLLEFGVKASSPMYGPLLLAKLVCKPLGRDDVTLDELRNHKSILKLLTCTPLIVHDDAGDANRLSLWQLNSEQLALLRRDHFRRFLELKQKVIPRKQELLESVAAIEAGDATDAAKAKNDDELPAEVAREISDLTQNALNVNVSPARVDFLSRMNEANALQRERTTDDSNSGIVAQVPSSGLSQWLGKICGNICGGSAGGAANGDFTATSASPINVKASETEPQIVEEVEAPRRSSFATTARELASKPLPESVQAVPRTVARLSQEMDRSPAAVVFRATLLLEIMLEIQKVGFLYTLDDRGRTVFHTLVEQLLLDKREDEFAQKFLEEAAEPEKNKEAQESGEVATPTAGNEEEGTHAKAVEPRGEKVVAAATDKKMNKNDVENKAVSGVDEQDVEDELSASQKRLALVKGKIDGRSSVSMMLFLRIVEQTRDSSCFAIQENVRGETVLHMLARERAHKSTALCLVQALRRIRRVSSMAVSQILNIMPSSSKAGSKTPLQLVQVLAPDDPLRMEFESWATDVADEAEGGES